MSESENQFEPRTDSGVEELRSELHALRGSFSTALVLLLVFSFCVNVFLFRQVSDLSARAKQATALVAGWSPGGAEQNLAIETWSRLTEFSKTHQDFMPIINKYSPFFNTTPTKPASPAPAAPKK
jgi:hypothetical protein